MSADGDQPSDAAVAEAAAAAAEGVVLDRYRQSAVDDLDVTVSFADGVLEVDVYVNPPDDADDADRVVEEAVAAAEAAADDLLESG